MCLNLKLQHSHQWRFALRDEMHFKYLATYVKKLRKLNLLYNEAMRSVFSQKLGRGFRGSGESRSTQPLTLFLREFLFHERFYFPCFNYEVFIIFSRNKVPPKKSLPYEGTTGSKIPFGRFCCDKHFLCYPDLRHVSPAYHKLKTFPLL